MRVSCSAEDAYAACMDTMHRIKEALDTATKRLAELQNMNDKSPRIMAAIEQIQTAMKAADVAHKTVHRVAIQAKAVRPMTHVDLDAFELSAISYGVEVKQ